MLGSDTPTHPQKQTNIIRAELIGSDTCTALGHTEKGDTPVLAMCRWLIEHGVDPKTPLLACRRDTLCLHVATLGTAAELAIGGKGVGFRPACAVVIGPWARFSSLAGVRQRRRS